MNPQTDPLDDATMDRLVQATLNVAPSPDFLPRVRAHIAEAGVDAEIVAALNVDPSPEFVAHVRQRIEEDEPTYVGSGFPGLSGGEGSRIVRGSSFPGLSGDEGSRLLRWQWLGAGALAAAAVLALLIVRPTGDAITRVQPPTQARSDIALAAPSPAPSTASVASADVAPRDVIRHATSGIRVVGAAHPETERLPAATRSEIEGLRQLLTAARSGLVDDSLASVPTLDSEQPLAPLPPLSIASLSVDTLDH